MDNKVFLMGDEDKDKKEAVSILEVFELSELLPGGVAFEIKQLEALRNGAMSDGDVSSIYSQLHQGLMMKGNPAPEGFTWTAVRKYYNL